jgi:ribosomal protein S12 methylthiotransferase accessory factor
VRAGSKQVDDHVRARLVAVAEAAERYAAGDFLREPVVRSTYARLEGPSVDPTLIPRCSPTELAHPGCRLRPFDPKAPIRWMRGTVLATGEDTWVPAVMACYELRDATPAERFWYRISTSYAVHTDSAEALVCGICEVIERDAVAVTWLQAQNLVLHRLTPPTCVLRASVGHRGESTSRFVSGTQAAGALLPGRPARGAGLWVRRSG